MKKFLSLFLAILLITGTMSVGVFSASAEEVSEATSFEVDFGTAHDTGSLAGTDGSNTYVVSTTYGSNWKVNSSSYASLINGNASTAVRIQRNDTTGFNFTQIKYGGGFAKSIFALNFTADAGEGMYDVSALVTLLSNGGYGNVYINGNCIGTINSYDANGKITDPSDVQELSCAYLKAGEYANTLVIIPTGASESTSYNVFLEGISFSKRNDKFLLDFGDAKSTGSLTYKLESKPTDTSYASSETYGYNWKIDPSAVYTGSTHISGTGSRIRIQKSNQFNFSQFSNTSDATFRFTATEGAGMYDVSAILTSTSGGRATVHINGEYIGTIQPGSKGELLTGDSAMTAIYFPGEKQSLSAVYLHSGENANALTITPTSSTTQIHFFDFTKSTVSPTSFKVDFGRAYEDSLLLIGDSKDYCVADTRGDNWKIDSANTATAHLNETSSSARIQVSIGSNPTTTYNFTTLHPVGDFAVKFTAPGGAGTYDVSALMNPMTDGGYGDIYINGAYVGSVNSYDSTAHIYNSTVVTQSIMTAELKAGEYANTLVISPIDENKKVYPQSFEFTKATAPESSGMTSKRYETSGNASVNAISAYTVDGTVIGADVIGSQNVSMGGKVSLSAPDRDGYTFLYWALGTSDKKRIVSYEKDFTYKPREGATQLIAVYENVNESSDKAEFYDANGELIESNTTGAFPALPSLPAFGRASSWKCYNDGEIYDGISPVAPKGTVIYVAHYDELRPVTVNGETYNYGDTVTLTATVPDGKYFKGFVKNGEIVCRDETYTFLAYENCTVTEEYADAAPLASKLVKIAIDSFVSGDITAVMAEFIGIDNAVEKGIIVNGNKIAMTGDGNQFTVTADENGTYIGYAILKNGNSFTLLTDGEYVK